MPVLDARVQPQRPDLIAPAIAPDYAFGGRIGVAVDRADALLVADDVGQVIWRVKPATSKQ